MTKSMLIHIVLKEGEILRREYSRDNVVLYVKYDNNIFCISNPNERRSTIELVKNYTAGTI